MAKITVKAKIDGGIHLKYGEIKAGQSYEIEEADFGDQLFERPPGFESPHERAERREAAQAPDVQPPAPETPEKAKKTAPPSSEAEKQEGGN
ncbi:MAG: hypothetical protein CVU59_05025 [Deltaproteobacteria bacterium HGW-Deltaproteobacteria-17]|jgi:hypothetical protein|nr:MAG: hypothetical protein CVU59_05025 [Deltaproteobacteria bacterium HGW-Deltaproteobacteria-17]